MYSSAPPPVADEDSKWYEEEAIVFLEKIQQKIPLPDNVVDLNPYQCRPDHLPGGMWFRVCSTESNKAEFGFWREKEAASEIFANSDITGWRAAFEFIEVREGKEERTNWLMQEYKLTKNGPSDDANTEKKSEALCRVFHSHDRNYIFNSGDYLELDDLADQLSHSSSSLNTSRTSSSFDEYFDPESLLRELESAEPDQTRLVEESSSGLTETASAISGSSVRADQSGKNQKADEREGDPSSSGKKKAADVKMKGLKKYLCLIAF